MKSDPEIARYMDMSPQAMSARARALREACKLSQEALADRLGLSVSAVKSWESTGPKSNGLRSVHVGKIATMMDIKTDFIILGDTREVVIRPELWRKAREVLLGIQDADPGS